MLTHEENELVTRVGPGTPMGDVMRRYWVPALLSWELAEPDCPPVRVRLLGEDLVAFRDTEGRVGLVDAFCAHRRASLFFGRNEECGLRCVYHGWKFDVARAAASTCPPSRPSSNFKDKVRAPGLPDRRGRRRHLGLHGPAGEAAGRRPFEWTAGAGDAPARVQGDRRSATGSRRWRAASTPRTPPSCTGCITAELARGRASVRRKPVRARQGADARGRPDRLRLPYAGIRPLDEGEHARPRLPLRHAVPSDPAAYQPSQGGPDGAPATSGCRWTTRTPWSTTGTTAPPRSRSTTTIGASARSGNGPDDVDQATFRSIRNRAQQLPDRPPGPEDADLHRHRRHQHPGPRDPGEHGADRRPQPGAPRPGGPGHHPGPPSAARRRQDGAGRRHAARGSTRPITRSVPRRACCRATPIGGRS